MIGNTVSVKGNYRKNEENFFGGNPVKRGKSTHRMRECSGLSTRAE
jgi:hypothetical protein